jgi:hypothetical protein
MLQLPAKRVRLLWWCSFGSIRRVDWLADARVSVKRAVSIVRAEVEEVLKMQTARFSETLASTNQSTRRINPKEHRQNCLRRENLKPHRHIIYFSEICCLSAS